MGKVFVYRPHHEDHDAPGIAYAEDGDELAVHMSSSMYWFRWDMGLDPQSVSKHDAYAAKYPDGFELVQTVGRAELESHIAAGELVGVFFDDADESEGDDE